MPGEVARLRTIVEPTIGVVTNVAEAHLDGFGDLDGVLREKVALLEDAPCAIVGLTPPALSEAARECAARVITAGLDRAADVHPDRWKVDRGRVELTFRGHTVRLPLAGRHQGDNAMLAIAAAVELELELRPIVTALAEVRLPPGRGELIEAGKLVILHDAYNANPASMVAALETAQATAAGRPLVMVVGSMLELGSRSRMLHEAVADAIVTANPALIGAMGAFVPALRRHAKRLGDRLITAEDAEALGRAVGDRLTGRELVLLKGSRGVQLELAIPHLRRGEA